ncbi:MAG: winged helix-turn-helix domain-containing protein [Halobacteriota archaeon]
MEAVLWQLLASSRGARSRIRIVRLLDERPRNANELAEALDLDYTTVRHHLDVLVDNKVVTEATEGYGAIYMFTEQVTDHWDVVETILETVGDER